MRPARSLVCLALAPAIAACTGGGATSGGEPDAGSPDAGSPDAFVDTVLMGDYVIENSLDVEALAGYTRITGNLRIQSTGLAAVSLPDLRVVEASLDMFTSDVETVSMPNLERVGARLRLTAVRTIEFPRLTTIGRDLHLFQTRLTDLAGLGALASIGQNLTLELNGSLTDVDGLSGLVTIPGEIDVVGGATIVGPGGLSNIASAGSVRIAGPWTDLQPLSGLQTIYGRLLIQTPGPFSTEGASALASIGSLELNPAVPIALTFPNLTSIGGPMVIPIRTLTLLDLPALTSVGGNVDVVNHPALTSVDLGSLTSVAVRVRIEETPSLTSVDLGSLATVGETVTVWAAPVLTSLNLGALEGAPNSLTIDDCDMLSTVSLPSLTSAGSLYVRFNASLVSLEVPLLTSVPSWFWVSENPGLSQCNVDAILTGLFAPPKMVVTGSNQPCP